MSIKNRSFKTLKIIFLTSLLLALNSEAVEPKYSIRFGYLLHGGGNKFSFLGEADLFPITSLNSTLYIGVEIKPKRNISYTFLSKVTLPNGNVQEWPRAKVKGLAIIPMQFDESDPEGEYLVNISFEDGNEYEKIFTGMRLKKFVKKHKDEGYPFFDTIDDEGRPIKSANAQCAPKELPNTNQ